MILLENKKLKLELNEDGSIDSMVAKDTDWQIVSHSDASHAFKLMLPLKNHYKTSGVYSSKRNNTVLSSNLTLPKLITAENSATFIWDTVTSEFGGEHKIKVTAEVKMTDVSAIFSMNIQNDSDVVVENTYYPYFCPFNIPDEQHFECFSRDYASPSRFPIYPNFANTRGYYGSDTPIIFTNTNPQNPYCFLRNEKQGLAVMVGERSLEPTHYQMKLYPGYGESMDGCHPGFDVKTIGCKDVYMDFTSGQLPFISPGENKDLIPILVEPFVGSWTAGADIWRRQRSKYFTKIQNPEWVDTPHSWLQYHINSPEDELRMPFRDLPKLAAQCKEADIAAIQLVGWNDGGQDQGNPYHDFDPRLGTFDDLKTAIKECQDIGVKIILFSKFNWADQGDPRYKTEQIQHTIKDTFGNPCYYFGYQYQTLSQFSNVRVKRLMPLCFNSEDCIDMCKHEFNKMIDAGASGNLYDECFHRGGASLCFDPTHRHRIPAATQGMDIDFAKIMMKDAPKDFLMSGEAMYDSMFESYHLSYFRTESSSHIPLDRYVANDCRIMTAAYGFSDRNMINQCLLYNYIVSYEPYHFKGTPQDSPILISYGMKMQKLRKELREHVWDGEFLYHGMAAVTENEKPYNEHCWSVFRSKKDASAAVVVTNYDSKKEKTVNVTFENGTKPTKYRLVDGEWQSYAKDILLPPNSAAVIL